MNRKVFWLHPQMVGVIYLFENIKDFDLIAMLSYLPERFDYATSAKEFIDQMEDHWCVEFLEKLHDEIEQRIINHWKEFAPGRLKEKRYRRMIHGKRKDS